MDSIFNQQNDRVYAADRHAADEQGGTRQTVKFLKRIMMWLGACKSDLTDPIVFEAGETMTYNNYIEIVLPHALSEGQRLIGNDFIYQQDNATPHAHKKMTMITFNV